MNACCNTFIAIATGFAVICGCTEQHLPLVIASPEKFHIQLPLTYNKRGITIATYWGQEKKALMLNLDNHSPTWVNNNVIAGNAAIKKSSHFLYSTTTADGKSIYGDVYVCDSIRMYALTFKNVALYNISTPENAGRPDGVIGENMMREGIWKIDFNNRRMQFASSSDFIEGWSEADILPTRFTGDAIELDFQFSHHISHTLELDLGYNGFIMMPADVFASITSDNKKIQKDSMLFSTPAGNTIVENSIAADSIGIGHQWLATLITTNPTVKENLVGLRFFSRFAFIIMDYPRKRIYVSKERRTGTDEVE